jgi:hypothetical protein
LSYFLRLIDLGQFRIEANQPNPGEPSLQFQGYGVLATDIAHQFQVKAGAGPETALEILGNKVALFYGSLTTNDNIRFNATFPALINNGAGSGKPYIFNSDAVGFNEFRLVLGATGGFTEFKTTGEAFMFNKAVRFDLPSGSPALYSNSPGGKFTFDANNTNLGALCLYANSGATFGGTTGSQTLHASALVEMKNDGRGFLIVKMTAAQMNAIVSPSPGLEVYNTTINALCEFNGTDWMNVRLGCKASETRFPTYTISEDNIPSNVVNYQNNELIGATKIHLATVGGTVVAPATVDPATGITNISAFTGDDILIIYK